jgi:hypothetical protein
MFIGVMVDNILNTPPDFGCGACGEGDTAGEVGGAAVGLGDACGAGEGEAQLPNTSENSNRIPRTRNVFFTLSSFTLF